VPPVPVDDFFFKPYEPSAAGTGATASAAAAVSQVPDTPRATPADGRPVRRAALLGGVKR